MDEFYLQHALKLAERAIGLSSPNPRVGCVLVKDGVVLGEGHTQAAGQAHAEVMAIRDAQSRGQDLNGCTAYVTLEPCSHFGRTPPCVDALKAIAPARVVVALLDANPQVSGSGVAALRAAGIAVEVLPIEHALARAAYELNVGFMTRMTTGSVYTRLKWAASADGKVALPDGRSQWITGEAARADGHGFRARADVVVSGIGTVLQDDPQLNVRGVHVAKPAVKCIIDSYARLPLEAKIFNDGAPVWLAVADLNADDGEFELQSERLHQLRAAHPQLQVLSIPPIGLSGRIDLTALWAYFSEQHFNEIHVEAGAGLNASLLESNLVDELLMYVAPRIVGAGQHAAAFGENVALDDLTHSGAWRWLDAAVLGEDMRLRLRRR
jgi:diaminohydroxyphosphoribosylaminopyrimidine deaminase/5-amino-6-(5-phosphoribosylamino)uracil reductase